MPQFAYKAKTSSSQLLSGVIEADDRRRAIRQLKAAGHYVLSITESRAAMVWSDVLRGRHLGRIRARDTAIAMRQLASLVGAGLTLAESLRILARQCENPKLARVAEGLAIGVEGSKPLSEAMADYPRVFTPQVTSIVRAGEEGGILPETLSRLADYQEDRRGV